MIDTMELGQKVRERREALKLSRRDLSLDAGVSESYVSHIERGRFRPSIEALRRIARRLGIPAPELLGELDPAADEIDLSTFMLVYNAAMVFMYGRRMSEEGVAALELAVSLYSYVREEARQGRAIDDIDQLANHMRRMQNLPLTRR